MAKEIEPYRNRRCCDESPPPGSQKLNQCPLADNRCIPGLGRTPTDSSDDQREKGYSCPKRCTTHISCSLTQCIPQNLRDILDCAGYSGHFVSPKTQSNQSVACGRLSFIQVYVTRETRQLRPREGLGVFSRLKGPFGSKPVTTPCSSPAAHPASHSPDKESPSPRPSARPSPRRCRRCGR